jgi:NOL1/NOP2/fmu family ribosome biogenesis protein
MTRVGIFLIIIALIGGTIGCASPPLAQYDLTISSTEGGSVIDPGEETFAYDEGEVVELVAKSDEGYYFVNWTGDVGTIADLGAPASMITMNSDCAIVANFARIPEYRLIVSSTAGGAVISPGEGTFTYGRGAVVRLSAKAEAGYHFVTWSGDVDGVANSRAAMTMITVNGNCTIVASFEEAIFTPMVAAGGFHTLGLKSDGTVVAVGYNEYGQCDVGEWTDIVQVAAGGYHTVGLKSDGTAVAVGYNGNGECNVGRWTDIVQVATGGYYGLAHTVGLKSDGTVVAVGNNAYGQCGVEDWEDIVEVAAGVYHTAGLRSDGTVVIVGMDWAKDGVSGLTDIIRIAAGYGDTVGLKADGIVVAAGANNWGQADVNGWTDIIRIAAGPSHTVGVRSDNTVVSAGYNYYGQCDVDGWKDIIQVAAGHLHTVGLRADGTVVTVGYNNDGQCNVGGWDLN